MGQDDSSSFPQLQPALILTCDWDTDHSLFGSIKAPGNHISFVKLSGTVTTAQGSDLPSFKAEMTDGGVWIRQEYISADEIWFKTEIFSLLKITDGPPHSSDPSVAVLETGLIKTKWQGVGRVPPSLPSQIETFGDIPELVKIVKKSTTPGSLTVSTCSFETSDPRYKFLEHAAFVGQSHLITVPADNMPGGHKLVTQVRVSCVKTAEQW